MSRRSAVVPRLWAARTAVCRLGAWLGVWALVLQLLFPLFQPHAAWAEEGLFPPTCSAHGGDEAPAGLPGQDDCRHCVLCLSAASHWQPSLAVIAAKPAFPVPSPVASPQPGWRSPRLLAGHPPLPSRGPPSVA